MDYLDKTATLTPSAKRVIIEKATEHPFSGAYNTLVTEGTYLCRRCGLALFRADNQFSAGCGWPSFDIEIKGAVKQIPDRDGIRTEITCNRCDAHLGHVFHNEGFTSRNCRYCVNSLALDFVANNEVLDTEEAIVAGGCFWGVDYYLKQIAGVLKIEVGYTGGMVVHPSYEQVCQGNTGHYEAVRIVFDKKKTNYYAILKRFFEIHDPTQSMGQGPDLGHQYQSAVFYFNPQQKADALDLINQLKNRGYSVETKLLSAQTFWAAEEYHQNYYAKHQKLPYCHAPVSRFK